MKSFVLIPLDRGLSARVSPEDAEYLLVRTWKSGWNEHTKSYYAYRWEQPGANKGYVVMSRVIMGLDREDPRQVDHVSHDTLDNRRENLRLGTSQQNSYNRRMHRDNESGFKGITKLRNCDRYQAMIRADGKSHYLGTRKTAEEAYALYVEAALRLHGEFACLV